MKLFVSAVLVIAGAIHLLPLSGFLGPAQLQSLYGVPVNEPNLEVLLRHRAVLFGLLGTFLIYAAFRPASQTIAIIGGLISTLAFLYVAWTTGGYNDAIEKVVYIDLGVALGLLAALAIRLRGGAY